MQPVVVQKKNVLRNVLFSDRQWSHTMRLCYSKTIAMLPMKLKKSALRKFIWIQVLITVRGPSQFLHKRPAKINSNRFMRTWRGVFHLLAKTDVVCRVKTQELKLKLYQNGHPSYITHWQDSHSTWLTNQTLYLSVHIQRSWFLSSSLKIAPR
jgi:hypothetical protein